MDAQSQNKQRQIILWKVIVWSLIPIFIGILAILSTHETIAKVKDAKYQKIVHKKDSLLHSLHPEYKILVKSRQDLIFLRLELGKLDDFVQEQKNNFRSYSGDQKSQLETDIIEKNIKFEEMVRNISQLEITDTLAKKFRLKFLEDKVIVWRHIKQESLSDEALLKTLIDELAEKDSEIYALRNQNLNEKNQTSISTAQRGSLKPTGGSDVAEVYALQEELKDLRHQANVHEKGTRAKIWKEQLAFKKQFVQKLQNILAEKKRIHSITPDIKKLIRTLNEEIEKMEMNPVFP